MKTEQNVIFLIEKDSESDVFAYFPQQKMRSEGIKNIDCLELLKR